MLDFSHSPGLLILAMVGLYLVAVGMLTVVLPRLLAGSAAKGGETLSNDVEPHDACAH